MYLLPSLPPPPQITKAAIQAMGQESRFNLEDLKVIKTESGRDRNCPLIPTRNPCPAVRPPGWRITVQGKTPDRQETWVYYADTKDQVTLDAPASLSPKVRRSLSDRFNIPPKNLIIHTAQLVSYSPPCPGDRLCPAAVSPAWRISGPDFGVTHVGLNGENFDPDTSIPNLFDRYPGDRAKLPTTIGRAAVIDLAQKLNLNPLSEEIKIASVKAITWNLCRGGSGPTQPERGICPDVDVSGWKILLDAGGLRWVYYENNGLTLDAAQTIAPTIEGRLKGAIARQARLSPDAIQIQASSVNSIYLAGCLDGQLSLRCRQSAQLGWRFRAIISGQTQFNAWTYQSNFQGTQVKLLEKGTWFPVP
jgi:hypothetical protein